MNISGKDYRKLYQTQDKVLLALKPVLSSFYLTGGTALGRFYLQHRFSEDLDFFMNKNDSFNATLKNVEKTLIDNFSLLKNQSVVYNDFVRYYVEDKETVLKIEFVNDIEYRCGIPGTYQYGFIDTPVNILTNKLTAIVGRDEPKDVFDIFSIASHYRFNWMRIFNEVRNKAIVNEIDVEQRIRSFPVQLLQNADWHILPVDPDQVNTAIQTIAKDFFLGKDNSLGVNCPAIENAMVKIS